MGSDTPPLPSSKKPLSSAQFIHSVASYSLWPHGLQYSRLPCPEKEASKGVSWSHLHVSSPQTESIQKSSLGGRREEFLFMDINRTWQGSNTKIPFWLSTCSLPSWGTKTPTRLVDLGGEESRFLKAGCLQKEIPEQPALLRQYPTPPIFNCRTISWLCCVGFRHVTTWISQHKSRLSHEHPSHLCPNIPPLRWARSAGLGSLCYMAASH